MPILGASERGTLQNYGAIGRFTIISGGQYYTVNDDIVVVNTTSRGYGAFGRITSVNANGAITGTLVALPSIAGFANVTSGSNVVIGQNTLFTTQLTANNNINTRVVAHIF